MIAGDFFRIQHRGHFGHGQIFQVRKVIPSLKVRGNADIDQLDIGDQIEFVIEDHTGGPCHHCIPSNGPFPAHGLASPAESKARDSPNRRHCLQKELIMPKLSDFNEPPKYLRGCDLPEDGSPVYVYIHDVQIERVGRENKLLPVLYFADDKGKPALKPLILGTKRDRERLAKDIDPNTDNLPGHKVRLWAVDSETPDGEATRSPRIAGAELRQPQQLTPGPKPLPPIVNPSAPKPELITEEMLTPPAKGGRPQKTGNEQQVVPPAADTDLNDPIPGFD
jgi:hypothetical protein